MLVHKRAVKPQATLDVYMVLLGDEISRPEAGESWVFLVFTYFFLVQVSVNPENTLSVLGFKVPNQEKGVCSTSKCMTVRGSISNHELNAMMKIFHLRRQ